MWALQADQFSFILRFAITEFRSMYVCICKSVSSHEIKDAVERGDVSSLSCLRKCLGVGTGCGICLESAKECLSDALARNLPCDAMAQYESPTEIRITAALA